MLKFKELHEDVFIEKNKKELFTYETWCRMLDGIDSHLLVESKNKEFLFEDWWSDYSPKQQAKYIKDHPDSDQAKQAKTKGLKGKDDDGGKLKKGSSRYYFTQITENAIISSIFIRSNIDKIYCSFGISISTTPNHSFITTKTRLNNCLPWNCVYKPLREIPDITEGFTQIHSVSY